MTIIRVVHNRENPYVQLNKEALWNPRLSLKAVGLWAKCLSRPDDWKFHVSELADKGVDKEKSIRSAIEELEKERFVLKLKHISQKENGRFNEKGGLEYVFFEFPYTDEERDRYIEEFKKCYRHCPLGNLRRGNLLNEALPKIDPTDHPLPPKPSDEGPPLIPPEGGTPVKPAVFSRPPKRKKLREEFMPRVERVSTTDSQHQSLLKEANQDESVVTIWYEELSKWKISKGLDGGSGDYRSIINWVIKAVKNKLNNDTKTSNDGNNKILTDTQKKNLELNVELVDALKLNYPNKKIKIWHRDNYMTCNDPDFDISLLISHEELKRYLEKKFRITFREDIDD